MLIIMKYSEKHLSLILSPNWEYVYLLLCQRRLRAPPYLKCCIFICGATPEITRFVFKKIARSGYIPQSSHIAHLEGCPRLLIYTCHWRAYTNSNIFYIHTIFNDIKIYLKLYWCVYNEWIAKCQSIHNSK